MTSDEYLSQRIDDQIGWYDRKSGHCQRMYKRLRGFEILAAALIPFLTGYVDLYGGKIKFLVGLLGVSVAVISGLLFLNKYQENWVKYRSTAEALRSEKLLYQTQSPPYQGPDAFLLFVQKAESIFANETGNWAQYIAASPKQEKQG
ncbi:MAG: DUF4231 domain-containing protein [Blastocatellia bacterium]|nr:DUF4231 domain-containing protein [Blastocatellia bacterium]